jgi:MEMO1 family protein
MTTRPAAVAGSFYPAAGTALRQQVRRWIDDIVVDDAELAAAPVGALIAPHAGYRYSGTVAATAYARLLHGAHRIRTVVLVGPAHFVSVSGVAASGATAFATPLGAVPVDRTALARALAQPGVGVNDAAHAPEHSLEVQLPFLMEVLGDFAIVPLLVGSAMPADVARAMEAACAGTGAIAVISSDLSHYLSRAAAQARDAATAAAIAALDPRRIRRGDACGRTAIQALLHVATNRGLVPRTLALRTSADAGGADDRVVGYGAFVFRPSAG